MQKFSKNQVNKAGSILKNKNQHTVDEVFKAENILTYWRSIHAPLITTFQALLRTNITNKITRNTTIAQRLKRSPSIIQKLDRYPNMKLSTMQDIAGIRAIMANVSEIYKLRNELTYKKNKHKFIEEYDYIKNPKQSGYRGIHLIFEYNNLKKIESNGLRIEVQIRSSLQHLWATSVETMGTYLNTSLKSNQGPDDILKFFELTGLAFSLLEKNSSIKLEKNHNPKQIFTNTLKKFKQLKIKEKLSAYAIITGHIIDERNIEAKFYLLALDVKNQKVTVQTFGQNEVEQANIKYTEVERTISNGEELQVVLVSTESIKNLKKAFPNYYLDTKEFLRKIESLESKIQ